MRQAWILLPAIAPLCACAAFQSLQERQATAAEQQLAAGPEVVHAAALRALPAFDLIAVLDIPERGFIEAHGDWESAQEGAVVQIAVQPDPAGSRIRIDAARSRLEPSERRGELARALLAAIRAALRSEDPSR